MGFQVVFASCLFIPMLVAGKLRESLRALGHIYNRHPTEMILGIDASTLWSLVAFIMGIGNDLGL